MSDKPSAHKAGSIHEIVPSRPPVSARSVPLQLSPSFSSQTSEYRPLQRAVLLSRPTLLILELLQPGNSKNRVESFTINRNCLIFVQIGEPQILFAIHALVNSRPSARRVDPSLQFSRVQRFPFSAQRGWRCLIHLLIDEQLLRPESPPRPRKHWNPNQDDNPLIA